MVGGFVKRTGAYEVQSIPRAGGSTLLPSP